MSQSFSLYGELTVRQNLELHARLFDLPRERIESRAEELIERFALGEYAEQAAETLPLGIRQRLSLAVALIHSPEILILDEPTSGVDPVARDGFWELLVDLSRNQGVTIFVSTHFMNEAERCDRISLMHAGRVLVSDAPASIVRARGVATLEEAFVAQLEEAAAARCDPRRTEPPAARRSESPASVRPAWFSPQRMLAYARREAVELLRDPIRLGVALGGSVLLMLMLGYGITLDVEDLPFAVLDRDQTPESHDYIGEHRGLALLPRTTAPPRRSRARNPHAQRGAQPRDRDPAGLRARPAPADGPWRWASGSTARCRSVARPSRATCSGLHAQYLTDLARRSAAIEPAALADLELRYRYNQGFASLESMVPGVIPMLLIFVPAILTALGVVRERELGSITNLYVTPLTRLEFLVGKQLPYVGLGMVSFFGMVALAVYAFGVTVKGSFTALTLGAFLYVMATTALGLLVSTFTRSQIAALAGTSILTLVPTVQFSGLTDPVSSLSGAAAVVGRLFPAMYFITLSRGAFSKALGFGELYPYHLALAVFAPALTLLSTLLLRKQGR